MFSLSYRVALSLITFFLCGLGTNESNTSKYRISSISAHFYYEGVGRFESRNLFTPLTALRNAFIGEGDAELPTSTTLILIHISGPTFRNVPGTLRVSVTEEGKHLLEQETRLGLFISRGNEIVLPLIVFGPRCKPLHIEASLKDTDWDGQTLNRTLPFICGE